MGDSAGDIVELTIERLAYGGDAVARLDGLVIFIPFGAPGDRVRVRLIERKKQFARAVIEEVVEASPHRREPVCRHFGDCGGCQFQHIEYAAQLEAKAGFVRDALSRIGRIDWPHRIEVRSASEYGYRSRAQVRLAPASAGTRRIGFKRAASESVCDIEYCPVLTPRLNTLLTRLREEAGGRPSKTDREIRLEMAEGDSAAAIEPAVAGLPSTQLTRAVGEFEYSFSPSTFFQGNRLLLEEMVATAVLGRAGSLALELYAGVGLFTLPLASQFSRVIAVESETDAAEFARLNIRNANASNIEYHQQRAEAWIAEYADRGRAGKSPIPDFVLLDPPRTGALDSSRHLARLGPKAVTYVSCDPPTLARDLRVLADSGYSVEQIVAFDLFPQTYHVETIAHLAKAG